MRIKDIFLLCLIPALVASGGLYLHSIIQKQDRIITELNATLARQENEIARITRLYREERVQIRYEGLSAAGGGSVGGAEISVGLQDAMELPSKRASPISRIECHLHFFITNLPSNREGMSNCRQTATPGALSSCHHPFLVYVARRLISSRLSDSNLHSY